MNGYVLVDCNNFFASCERLFRPDLSHLPIAILSNNDGCIIARTQEVKDLGVPMGQAYFKSKELLQKKGVVVLSSNYELYADLSHRVMKLLMNYTADVQIYSVDEAFLYFHDVREPAVLCAQIRQDISRAVGLPVSVGFAPTKTLAKLANHLAKKCKEGYWVMQAPPGKLLLDKIPVGDVWGIGRRLSKSLNTMGVSSAWQLCQLNEKIILKVLSINGLKTVKELKGIVCFNLENQGDDKKSIISSRSFGEKVTDFDVLHAALTNNILTATKKLRKQGSLAHNMSIYIRSSSYNRDGYYSASHSLTMSDGTDSSIYLSSAIKTLLTDIFKPGVKYMKTGVCLFNFSEKQSQQRSLFSVNPCHDGVMKSMDALNKRYDKRIVTLASAMLGHKQYGMKQGLKTPRYTTCWDEL